MWSWHNLLIPFYEFQAHGSLGRDDEVWDEIIFHAHFLDCEENNFLVSVSATAFELFFLFLFIIICIIIIFFLMMMIIIIICHDFLTSPCSILIFLYCNILLYQRRSFLMRLNKILSNLLQRSVKWCFFGFSYWVCRKKLTIWSLFELCCFDVCMKGIGWEESNIFFFFWASLDSLLTCRSIFKFIINYLASY